MNRLRLSLLPSTSLMLLAALLLLATTAIAQTPPDAGNAMK